MHAGTTHTGRVLSIFFYYDPISSASVPALSMSMHPPCILSNLVAARTGYYDLKHIKVRYENLARDELEKQAPSCSGG